MIIEVGVVAERREVKRKGRGSILMVILDGSLKEESEGREKGEGGRKSDKYLNESSARSGDVQMITHCLPVEVMLCCVVCCVPCAACHALRSHALRVVRCADVTIQNVDVPPSVVCPHYPS